MSYGTTNLISRIEQRAALPEGRYTDAEILDAATQTMLSEVLPIVRSVHQEYYVTRTTIATVADQYSYDLPERAVGQALREVKLLSGGRWIDLPHEDLEYVDTNIKGQPYNCYVEGNKLIVFPTPQDAQDTLVIWYYRSPSKLVAESETYTISSIDTGTNTITLSGSPSWTAGTDTLDIISSTSGYTVLDTDQSFSSISTTDITFSTLPDNVAVGRQVALSEQTSTPELPNEAQNMLIYLTAANLLFDMGDRENGAILRQSGERLANAYLTMVNPRISGAPKPFSEPWT